MRVRAASVPAYALDRFAATLAGDMIRPGDANYDERRRIWNGSIDRFPAAILSCANAGDVQATVRLAAEHDLLVAVRGGGHSFPGMSTCDGGIVIDMAG